MTFKTVYILTTTKSFVLVDNCVYVGNCVYMKRDYPKFFISFVQFYGWPWRQAGVRTPNLWTHTC